MIFYQQCSFSSEILRLWKSNWDHIDRGKIKSWQIERNRSWRVSLGESGSQRCTSGSQPENADGQGKVGRGGGKAMVQLDEQDAG